MQRRDYTGTGDLRGMQALVQRLWSPQSRWHVGDVAWGRHAIPGAEGSFRTSLWSAGTDAVAWGWAELPGHLDLVVDPAYADIAADVLLWFDDVAGPAMRTSTVLETETHLIDALATAGYVAQSDAPYFTQHLMTLDDLPDLRLPDGFVVRHVEPGQAERRAGCIATAGRTWFPGIDRELPPSHGHVALSTRARLGRRGRRRHLGGVGPWLVGRGEPCRPFGTCRMRARLPKARPGAGGQCGDAPRPSRRWRNDGCGRAARR